METYRMLAGFAQTWGLLYFVLAFLAVVAFVLRPKSRSRYDAAARLPLSED